jgi:hypothetical protein
MAVINPSKGRKIMPTKGKQPAQKPNPDVAIGSEWLSTEEAAEFLGLRKKTLDNWRSSGRRQLPFHKPFGRVTYKTAEVKKFFERSLSKKK